MHYTAAFFGGSMTTAAPQLPILENYLEGRWRRGQGNGQTLVNPATGEAVAWCATEGVDFAKALAFAREKAGPVLRSLSFSQRAGLLGRIADALTARRDRWYEIARINSGNTQGDA